MELMKIFWRRNSAGIWAIADMVVLNIGEPPSTNFTYFPIQDDVVITQSPPIGGTTRSVMGESIVPIVAHVNGEDTLRCIGTGFFVSCSGLLITAAHVVTDPIDRKYGKITELSSNSISSRDLSFGVLVPTNPLFQRRGYIFYAFEWTMFLAQPSENPLPIPGINLRINSDIAICKVLSRQGDYPHQPLTIIQPGVTGIGTQVGATVFALGYPGMADMELKLMQPGEILGECGFNLHMSSGKVLERYPDNFTKKHVPTPGPCFSFAAQIPSGMSGGPILDRERIYVHGVVSKGWETESGIDAFSFGSMLQPSMHLPISQLNGESLAQVHKSDKEGMAKFSAPGI
jgi:trypsin-like peptidase